MKYGDCKYRTNTKKDPRQQLSACLLSIFTSLFTRASARIVSLIYPDLSITERYCYPSCLQLSTPSPPRLCTFSIQCTFISTHTHTAHIQLNINRSVIPSQPCSALVHIHVLSSGQLNHTGTFRNRTAGNDLTIPIDDVSTRSCCRRLGLHGLVQIELLEFHGWFLH